MAVPSFFLLASFSAAQTDFIKAFSLEIARELAVETANVKIMSTLDMSD